MKNIKSKTRPGAKQAKASVVTVPSSIRVVADVMRSTLTYKQRVNMGGSAGVIVQKFRGNDLFDPDVSGVGAQPYGFDQMMTFYSKYRVLSSKIECWFCSVGTSAGTQSFNFVVVPTATGVSFASLEDASAAPYAKWGVNQGLSNPARHVIHSMATGKMEGVPITKVRDEDTYSGSASASVTSGFDWQILTQSVDLSSALSCFLYVTISYDTEFYERVNLALS